MAPPKGIRIRSAPERIRDLYEREEDEDGHRLPRFIRLIVAFFFFLLKKVNVFIETQTPILMTHLQNARCFLVTQAKRILIFLQAHLPIFMAQVEKIRSILITGLKQVAGFLGPKLHAVKAALLSEYHKFKAEDGKRKIWKGAAAFGIAVLVIMVLQTLYFRFPSAPAKKIDLPAPVPLAATWPPSPIPGSNLETAEEAGLFRDQLACSSREGKWEEEPIPRLLPWPYDKANLGHCDEKWVDEGGISEEKADAVVDHRLPASEWNVRPGLKYVWKVDKWNCGLDSQVEELTGREIAKLLTAGPAKAGAEGSSTEDGSWNERVILMVGDSVQYGFASSIYDTLRMGDPDHGSAAVVPSSLPCYIQRLEHRMVCWGVHFFAKTQPGLKMVFIRNDFSSPITEPTWTSDGKHYQVPWITTLASIVKGDYEWLEGGEMPTPARKKMKKAELSEGAFKKSPRGNPLPPIVVLNTGLQYTPDEQFLGELNTSLQAVRRVCPHCLVFFRNTPGGHKECNDVQVPLAHRPASMGMSYSWEHVARQSQDPRTKRLVEDAGAIFLDVESMTAFRADGHTGRNRQGKEDCSHYCAPGPQDFWTKLLFHSLKRLLQGPGSN